MIQPRFLFAAAAAVLAASPLAARPMTAKDMQSMHRIGSPEVSRDGRYAVFTISDTDCDENKRVNTLYLLDLTKRGPAPQAITGAEKGHDAVFGPDGSIWFLMALGDHVQLFRMTPGAAPVQVSNYTVDVGGLKHAPTADLVVCWAARPACPKLA